jgi:tRNA-(MS[2]IO[6]A)-hydroxylase (MiaE)-like
MVPAGGTDLRAAALYAALTEFERLAALAPLAPELADRLAVADAVGARYGRLRAALDRLGIAGGVPPDAAAAVEGSAAAVDDARRRTATVDWWEGLVAADLCGVLSDELFGALGGDADEVGEPADAQAAVPVLPVERIHAALAADPVLAARLALWGRRLAGESIVLARIFGAQRYPELADRLALAHAARLAALGLGRPAADSAAD